MPTFVSGRPWAGPIGVFAVGVVVKHEHFQPQAIACAGVFQHLAVAGRVAERGDRPAADHEVNALRLAGIVVVDKELRLLGQDRLAVAVIAVLAAPAVPTTCSGWNAVDPLGISARNPGRRR